MLAEASTAFSLVNFTFTVQTIIIPVELKAVTSSSSDTFAMYRGVGVPWLHPSTPDDITTINYTLSWPHLENPSNTTFAGSTQIDICRCPRSDLQQQTEEEPGHIYTRYECVGPTICFNSPDDELWVLQASHGPLNMLRPATTDERQRRQELHNGAEATAYSNHNFLFLSGPCPRGRYQACATLEFLKSLESIAREQVSQLTLLLQPFEEDCSVEASRKSYENLVEYIVLHLPSFRELHLNVWDDEMTMRGVASVFSVLLDRENTKITMGYSRWRGTTKDYRAAGAFLEALNADAGRTESCNSTSEGRVRRRVQEIEKINQGDEANDE